MATLQRTPTPAASHARILRGLRSAVVALSALLPNANPVHAANPATPPARSAKTGPLTFERDIRPILKANCLDCHGETDKPKAGLDLRLRRLMVKGGETGPAIEPGKPGRSHLIELIRSGAMPKREKKLTPQEIATIERWVAQGAPTARPEPDQIPAGMTITEEERSHWAYQPVRRPSVPSTRSAERARTPIDALLLPPLRERRIGFSADADRTTLLRRLHTDLLGLPPSPADVGRFLADTAPDAYEREIDRLLALPQYGERWGRHWLDIAGYAESDGGGTDDSPRPYAYKYRDWVIRAIQADKPFDQFVIEQLAGDELVDRPHSNLTAEQWDRLIATGFLRMAPDGTASAADATVARNQVMSDTIKIVTSSLMGLTVGCAQCHDHRYDPIPQTDYFRIRAVFEPAYDWKNWRPPGQRLISLYTTADREKAAAVEKEAAVAAQERDRKQSAHIEAALAKELLKFPKDQQPLLNEAFHAPADKRTPAQKKLIDDNPSVNISAGTLYQYNAEAAEELKKLEAKIGEIRARKPEEDFVSVLDEPGGTPPVTHRFHRGDPMQPQEPVRPGAPGILTPGGQALEFPDAPAGGPSSGRRLAFARWIASTNNPVFARVIVNRVWMGHFGRGLVKTPADFGAMGEKPTHPELLDWLASEFAQTGWSLKHLHRLILTSTAYRQSSSPRPSARAAARPSRAETVDPEATLYWRQRMIRLDAEALRDATLAVSGDLNLKAFGPSVPVRMDVTGQVVVGVEKTSGDNKMPVDVPLNGEENRRSIYVQVRRSQPLAFLNAFDAPPMELNCERRQPSTSAPQSLMLMNSQFVLDRAASFATRLEREAGPSPAGQVEKAWMLAFSRPPSPAEAASSTSFLASQAARVRSQAEAAVPAGKPSVAKDAKPEPSPETQALRHLCQNLLMSNEFLYIP